MNKNKKLIIILIGLLIVLVVLAGIVYWQEGRYLDKLQVVFLDIGQGDAIYIRTPAGQDILVDGGPDNKVVDQLGRQMPFWDRQLELVVLTHPDADHVTGLVEILKRYKIERVLFTAVKHQSSNYDNFKKTITEKNISTQIAQAGQIFNLGEDFFLEVLYPLESLEDKEIKPANNGSIVLLLDYGEVEFLLTGDLEEKAEREILFYNDKLDVEVLKVSHHGSKSSTTEEFLDIVNPEYAVIQSGQDNRFNHPHEITLEKLKNNNIKILRNDQLGAIKFISDGKNYQFLVK